MLTLSKQSEYGLIILSYIHKKNKLVSLSELVRETKLPRRFIARIASNMTANKLLISREGRVGGYRLTKKIDKINLYDFLKVFEGDFKLVKCADSHYNCCWEKICCQKSFLGNKLNKIIIKELKKWTIKDLLSS